MPNEFLRAIYLVIHQIPPGKVCSYGLIAKMAGYPGYARHVGKALAQLPEGSQLPWHRVLNSQGQISLKGQRFDAQRQALLNEKITVSETGRVSLKQYLWQGD
ncbi:MULTISPECIES: MGMT family protein [unclassified Vibrio]|uniref:MGMT family protein n=1 Tax=Vibrio sp. HB236076 TaxID=3232307 RepID=A0AB39HG15_9VIBR|nr:MGMT family protein [Vibrio sp. HB161653]MDP5253809.1 MGMT family protein [Vibrio sp. HB161653]